MTTTAHTCKAPVTVDQVIAWQSPDGRHVVRLQRTRSAYTVVVEQGARRLDERCRTFATETEARAYARAQAEELRGTPAGVPAAIEALAAAGISRRVLAAELRVHRTTVARWAAGSHQPSARNRAALRQLVDELHAAIDAEDIQLLADHRQAAALRVAREALLTDTDRAEIQALADRLAGDLERYQRPPCDNDADLAA